MKRTVPSYVAKLVALVSFFFAISTCSRGQAFELKNESVVAHLGPRGLVDIKDAQSKQVIQLTGDEFALVVGEQKIESTSLLPIAKAEKNKISYEYRTNGYNIRVTYALSRGWRFVTKKLEIVESPSPVYTLARVAPLQITLGNSIESTFTPEASLPQLGTMGEEQLRQLSDKKFGAFLRLQKKQGLMLVVQNPFLEVAQNGQCTTIAYRPAMTWKREWGPLTSDLAIIGVYQQSSSRIPFRMLYEWKALENLANDGADKNEIQAFTECVRQFLLHPSPSPISVEVGWTLNDYQIDVATLEGRAEYKRVMDTASDLGIQNLLYAPANHDLALLENDVDDWNWEHVLWLGLGQAIRKGQWDVEKSPIPDSVSEMLAYAKSKKLGVLAYVYPSLPFAQSEAWIVTNPEKKTKNAYATLASREFQDFLIHELIAFKHRTSIAGYSFDYAFFDIPGSSVYSQWRGWRRVLESLRQAESDIVIDGRQTYQVYGPWSWLAGSYPHPTGNDEQPESFTSYPDLHFDRVSADRMRFVNYWYRNYQFAPEEVIPGYMTHQTARNTNIVVDASSGRKVSSETVYSGFRKRDWDYLGYKYSVLSSIATAGWNNVVDMIPGRDPDEFEHFSTEDKTWIRDWLKWSIDHKDLLKRTRTILGQPAMGTIDGTAAVEGDRGFVFLFNPNYRSLSTQFKLDASIGLAPNAKFVLRELYPQKGKLIGKPGEGIWMSGDALTLGMEGTSAMVLELVSASEFEKNTMVFGVSTLDPQKPVQATLSGDRLRIEHAAGEIGSKAEILVHLERAQNLKEMEINGKSVPFTQKGRNVTASLAFGGAPFSHSQEVSLQATTTGLLGGTFTVPSRIQKQLAKRRELWPIPWTKEDYATTWLAPERLLLFLQMTEPQDSMNVQLKIDDSPVSITRAYSSVREDSSCFVGWYADLSNIAPDKQHTVRLTLPKLEPGRFQGLFFDNIEDEYTEQLAE